MSKADKEVAPAHPVAAAEAPKCSVCGQSTGELPGKAGPARWHAACESARPDVIAKVKARAGATG
jgi:hypothetical protein